MWACNKRQTASLESIQVEAAKKILGCSSKTCNEAVRGDMGLESLKARRDRCKIKWWCKVNNLDDERYPRLLLDNEWEVKPCRGRQKKTWRKLISDLLLQLNIDSQEILAEDYNVNLFLVTVDNALRNRKYKDFNDGLNSKVKLSLYKSFCKEIEFKNYLQRVGDPGTRLMFNVRSGTNGLNEDIGVKMAIGSISYVGMNVRVWYICSGSVLYMIALEYFHGRIREAVGGEFSTL